MRTARRYTSHRVSTPSKHFYLSQQPLCAVSSLHGGGTSFRNFTASAFSERTRLLFIIPLLFCSSIFSLFAKSAIQRFHDSQCYIHYITLPLLWSLRATITRIHISYTHSLQSLKVLRGRRMVSRGNWLVLAGTGTDGLVLMGGMG